MSLTDAQEKALAAARAKKSDTEPQDNEAESKEGDGPQQERPIIYLDLDDPLIAAAFYLE